MQLMCSFCVSPSENRGMLLVKDHSCMTVSGLRFSHRSLIQLQIDQVRTKKEKYTYILRVFAGLFLPI